VTIREIPVRALTAGVLLAICSGWPVLAGEHHHVSGDFVRQGTYVTLHYHADDDGAAANTTGASPPPTHATFDTTAPASEPIRTGKADRASSADGSEFPRHKHLGRGR
jgi:hypothetical protein